MELVPKKTNTWIIITLSFLLLFSSGSFAEQNINTLKLLSILRSYSDSGLSKIDKEKREHFIYESSNIYRKGISAIWLYSKWIQLKNLESSEISTITKIEDEKWFQSTTNLILEWDRNDQPQLDEESITNIDTLIEKVEYFSDTQKYFTNVQKETSERELTSTNKNNLKKEYAIGSSFVTFEQLKQLLKTENLIQEGKLILITSVDHVTGLVKLGNNYHYFDDSEPDKIITNSTDDLTECIFKTHFRHTDRISLALTIFSFDEKALPYPSQKELLNRIDPFLVKVNQKCILSILRSYLNSGLSKIDREKRERFINKSPKGYCAGISALWLYAKWLQIKKVESNDIYGPITKIEDKEWFQSTINLILEWNTNDKLQLDKEAIINIDTFIEKIDFFQNTPEYLPSIQQTQLEKIITDTNKGGLRKEYAIGLLCTLAQLKQLLKTENLIQEGKLILICSNDHATALIKEGNNYYYLNPSELKGEIKTNSIDDIAQLIFNANFQNASDLSYPLKLQIFSFDEKSLPYPPQKELLNRINPSLVPEKNYKDTVSELIMAARSGSLESVEYFLEKGIDPNTTDAEGYTALMYAAQDNYPEIIKAILKSDKVNPNVTNRRFGHTALMIAVSKNNPQCVEALLNDPKTDLNIVDKNGYSALAIADTLGSSYKECERALIEKGATQTLGIIFKHIRNYFFHEDL